LLFFLKKILIFFRKKQKKSDKIFQSVMKLAVYFQVFITAKEKLC